MKRTFSALTIAMLLTACGGGGVDTTPVVKADPTPTDNNQNTGINVPANFDFSNFQTVKIDFTIPGDLIGQIDYKIAGFWDDQVQDLYIGRGLPNAEKSVSLNIPSTLTTVSIEYLAFDKASNTYQVLTVEESI